VKVVAHGLLAEIQQDGHFADHLAISQVEQSVNVPNQPDIATQVSLMQSLERRLTCAVVRR